MIHTSILTCSFNHRSALSVTIGSVLSHLRSGVEYLILDDGSGDGTWEALLRLRLDNLRIVRNDNNMGITASRNRLLREARGKFISILDAGDLLALGKTSTHSALLNYDSSIGVVCGRALVKTLGVNGWSALPFSDFKSGWDLATPYNFILSGMTFRKSCLEAIGGFRELVYTTEGIDAYLRVGDFWKQHYSSQIACIKFRNLQSDSQKFSEQFGQKITQKLFQDTLERRYGKGRCYQRTRDQGTPGVSVSATERPAPALTP